MALHDIYALLMFGDFEVEPPSIAILFDPARLRVALPLPEVGLRISPPIKAILDPILVLIGVAVAGLFWGIWRHKHKQREAVLDSAWREVMADPHYLERRHFEERRFVTKDHHHEGA